jgi:hypothetical protein
MHYQQPNTSLKCKRRVAIFAYTSASDWVALIVLVFGLGTAPTAAPGDGPTFIIQTAEGKDLRGQLSRIAVDWSVQLDGDDGRTIAGPDVITVRAAGQRPAMPGGRHLLLTNGDRLPFESARLEGERLYLRNSDLDGGKEASLPLPAVAAIWFDAPGTIDDPERLRRALISGTRTRDRVILRNGDVLEGVLSGLNDKKSEVDVNGKLAAADLSQMAAVSLSSELAETLRPKGVYARAVLDNGTRLSLRSASCSDGATLEGETLFKARLRVSLNRLAALDLYQGRAVYLSDLKPTQYEHRPYLDTSWPFVMDGSVAGRDLRLAGGVYDKGIGLHSHSRLTYALNGDYQRFEALVGLDTRSGRGGSVRVRVLADGKTLDLGTDRELTARTAPLNVTVPVNGVKKLTLEVDFGGRGDVEDHVNWVDARLIR